MAARTYQIYLTEEYAALMDRIPKGERSLFVQNALKSQKPKEYFITFEVEGRTHNAVIEKHPLDWLLEVNNKAEPGTLAVLLFWCEVD